MARRLVSSLWLGFFLAGHMSVFAGARLRSEMRQVCNCSSLFCIRPHHHPPRQPAKPPAHCHSSGGQETVSLEGCPPDDEPLMASWFYVLPQPPARSHAVVTTPVVTAAAPRLAHHVVPMLLT